MCAFLVVLVLVASVGCTTAECSLDARVGEHVAEHDALDCRFAHNFNPVYGAPMLVGRETVHDCIAGAIDRRRAFVGGYIIVGIDSAQTYAYLGTATGQVTLLYEYWFGDVELSSSRCSQLELRTPDARDIGVDCLGRELAPVCTSRD